MVASRMVDELQELTGGRGILGYPTQVFDREDQSGRRVPHGATHGPDVVQDAVYDAGPNLPPVVVFCVCHDLSLEGHRSPSVAAFCVCGEGEGEVTRRG